MKLCPMCAKELEETHVVVLIKPVPGKEKCEWHKKARPWYVSEYEVVPRRSGKGAIE